MESSLKLVRRFGSVSNCAEELSPLITRSAAAAPSVRLRVFLSDVTSASMARRGCRSSCPSLTERCLGYLVFSMKSSNLNGSVLFLGVDRFFLQSFDIGPPKWVDQAQILFGGGRGSTIGEGGDTTIASPGRSPKQLLPGIGLHDDPLHGRQASPDFIAFDQGVRQICPR